MLQRILTWAFYILFFATPLFFTQYNHELFEYNKMMLVYGLTLIITGTWLLKMIWQKKLIWRSTPLDIPVILFFASQLLSTIFSIDPHTSWWGYYSRSNGGLYSVISYILLYYALVSNFEAKNALNFLKAALFGGLIVALYAIPEHFGVSPSCLILINRATDSCWVQDVQARVFATLGQPNWLAAYLEMLIFPAIYFFLTSTKKILNTYYLILTTCLYLAFTFTFSRGGSLGLLAGFVTLVVLHFGRTGLLGIASSFHDLAKTAKKTSSSSTEERVEKYKFIKPFLIIVLIFALINIYFGSALTSFKLEKFSAPPRPAITGSGGGTQLENGGTESGQIRLIVWKGAWEIFKHYPILGSGVETFAYSYYQFRPAEHNLVSEWDFLYNKAHNEYLNYLATTGALGFGAYMLLVFSFIAWSIKYYVLSIKGTAKTPNTVYLILIPCLLASYASFLVQNFFGFSVVIIALFFFLFPALAFVVSGQTKETALPKIFTGFSHWFSNIIFRRAVYSKILSTIAILFTFYFLLGLFRIWKADTIYKLGSDYEDAGDIKQSYEYLYRAVNLNKDEPLFRSDLGFITAAAASGSLDKDATLAAELKDDALNQTQLALSQSPANVSLWRTAIRTYYQLASIDASFEQKTLDVLDHTISMAPTDPKLYYNKALILSQDGKNKEAVEALQQAIKLKSNYREAYLSLGETYGDLKDKDQAKAAFEQVLKLSPNDAEALKDLADLDKKP